MNGAKRIQKEADGDINGTQLEDREILLNIFFELFALLMDIEKAMCSSPYSCCSIIACPSEWQSAIETGN